jgi:hypothetical protein
MLLTTHYFAFGSCFSLYYFSLFNYSMTVNQDSIPNRRKIYCPQCTDLVLGSTQSPIPAFCLGQEVNNPCPSSIKVMNTWRYTSTTNTSCLFQQSQLCLLKELNCLLLKFLHLQSNLTTRRRWVVGHMPPLGRRLGKTRSESDAVQPVALSLHQLSCLIS